MNAKQFRRLVLGLESVTEGAHMGHPDFRLDGRIFATLTADEKTGMVSLTPEQQERFMREHPATFTPAAGAWGRGGSTLVPLAAADPDVVGEAATVAWQNAAAKNAAKKSSRSRPRRRSTR
jgi:hypothetical protein